LCDANGRARGPANSGYVKSLIRNGVQLQECPNGAGAGAGRRPPRPNGPGAGAGMLCDANGRARGRASSGYVQALIRNGVQLQECPNGAGRRLPRPNGAGVGMLCDANGRQRGRANSGYVQALIRKGTQLQPCPAGGQGAAGKPAGGLGGRVGGGLGGRVGGGKVGGPAGDARLMCDPNGKPRGRASSGYVQTLVRNGMQLVPCATIQAPAKAMGADPTDYSASASTPAPAWAIALIVFGSLFVVLLIVVTLRLGQILRRD